MDAAGNDLENGRVILAHEGGDADLSTPGLDRASRSGQITTAPRERLRQSLRGDRLMSMVELIDASEITGASVTICSPGKRSREIVERPRQGSTPIITATALQWPEKPSIVPTARNDRRTAQERVEAAQRAEAQSVALSQPHRAGSDDPLAGYALGRYCLRRWPVMLVNGQDARKDIRECRAEAGNRFAQAIDNDRVARGFAPRLYGESGHFGELSPEEMAKRRDECARARAEAEAAIRDIHDRSVAVMTRLCWEDRELGSYDDDLVMHALYRLARHFEIERRGAKGY